MATKSSYTASAEDVFELFSGHLVGAANRPALVLSERVIQPKSREALEKSLKALGYSDEPCCFASLFPSDSHEDEGDVELDPGALYMLVEGLDPLFVIATDEPSAAVLANAYRCRLLLDSPVRIFGRPGVVFSNLNELIASQPGKKRAWSLLKTLHP